MLKTPIARGVALATLGASLTVPSMAHADFFADSKASVETRSFYFNADNRQEGLDPDESKSEEWAQGFILRYQSGFTEGPVGFGVDGLGLLGVKLDSSPDRTGSGMLPVGSDGRSDDDFGNFGLTGKARVSKSTLYLGTLQPKLPTVLATDSRIVPQTFRGGMLTVDEIKNLNVTFGRLTENSLRSEAGYDDMLMTNVAGGTETDKFDFGQIKYKWNDNLTTSYDYGKLHDNYKQHIFNLVHVLALGEDQSLKSDIRYARTSEDGDAEVDNNAFGAMFSYSLSGHTFGLGYQKMSGDTGYAYINGTDAFLVNYVMIDPAFASEDETSWQARYDYNFAAVGIPGLSLMTRYVRGDGYDVAGGNGQEWERDTDIAYVFQSGALKNLGVKWRNGTYRGDNREIDQNRLIVSYTIPLM